MLPALSYFLGNHIKFKIHGTQFLDAFIGYVQLTESLNVIKEKKHFIICVTVKMDRAVRFVHLLQSHSGKPFSPFSKGHIDKGKLECNQLNISDNNKFAFEYL